MNVFDEPKFFMSQEFLSALSILCQPNCTPQEMHLLSHWSSSHQWRNFSDSLKLKCQEYKLCVRSLSHLPCPFASSVCILGQATLLLWVPLFSFKNQMGGAGEMAQWLKSLAVLPEDPGSIPSTHMAAHNSLSHQFQGIWHPHTDIQAGKSEWT